MYNKTIQQTCVLEEKNTYLSPEQLASRRKEVFKREIYQQIFGNDGPDIKESYYELSELKRFEVRYMFLNEQQVEEQLLPIIQDLKDWSGMPKRVMDLCFVLFGYMPQLK